MYVCLSVVTHVFEWVCVCVCVCEYLAMAQVKQKPTLQPVVTVFALLLQCARARHVVQTHTAMHQVGCPFREHLYFEVTNYFGVVAKLKQLRGTEGGVQLLSGTEKI